MKPQAGAFMQVKRKFPDCLPRSAVCGAVRRPARHGLFRPAARGMPYAEAVKHVQGGQNRLIADEAALDYICLGSAFCWCAQRKHPTPEP